MVRRKLKWSPQWEGGIKTWTKSYASRNLWRCDPILSLDDLTQEGYLIYVKVYERYPRVNRPGHFFSLYKTSYCNYIHDQSRYKQHKDALIDDSTDDNPQYIGEYNEGYVRALCQQVPELQAALEYVTCNRRRLQVHKNETLNMQLWRMLGSSEQNITKKLKQLLTEED